MSSSSIKKKLKIYVYIITVIITALLSATLLISGSLSKNTGGNLSAISDSFTNIYKADIEGNGDYLWVVVAGKDKQEDDLSARVFQIDSKSAVSELTSPTSRPIDKGEAIDLGVYRNRPCLAYKEADGGSQHIRCNSKGEWVELPHRGIEKKGSVTELRSMGASMAALFSEMRGRRAVITVKKWNGKSWKRVCKPIRRAGSPLAAFGSSTLRPRSAVVLSLEVFKGGSVSQYYVIRCKGTSWMPAGPRLKVNGNGPLLSGALVIKGRLITLINNASIKRWTSSLYYLRNGRWRKAVGSPLNRGPGSAQGGISYTGGKLWATWQQNRLRKDGLYIGRTYLARVDTKRIRTERVLKLSSGAFAPGPLKVGEGAGRVWALYPIASKADSDGAMQVEVKAIP